jgi:putative hemolysin
MDWIAVLAILASLLLIGFLSGIEIAFVSSNKLSIELNKKQGTHAGKTWGRYVESPARFIGTTLVAVNIVIVVYGLLVSDMLYPVWKWIENNPRISDSAKEYLRFFKLFIETILSTCIVLFVEFLSKAVFRARSSSVLRSDFISYTATMFYWLLSSIAAFFVNIAEWILKYIFNVKLNAKKEVFSKMDLEHFIQQNKNNDEEEQSELNKELFENALSISDVKLRECLVPRREIEAVESNSDMAFIKSRFIDTRLSKLVVFENNIDNILGYIHQLDMFRSPRSVRDILHPIPTVPETMSATDLMNKFTRERKTIAWVVDEFGGTAGIVTMEDLLEEIFGEIMDEYDEVEELVDKQLAANEFIFSGRVELDFITEKYGLEFPGDSGSETLSGYIIQNNESIPRQKERIIFGKYEFDILSVSATRIETVKLKVLK